MSSPSPDSDSDSDEIQVSFEFDYIQENDYHGALQLLKAGLYSSLFPSNGSAGKGKKRKRKAKGESVESFVDDLIKKASDSVSRIEYDDSPISLLTLISRDEEIPLLLMERLVNVPPHCTPQLFRHFLQRNEEHIKSIKSIRLATRIFEDGSAEKGNEDVIFIFPEYEFFAKYASTKAMMEDKIMILTIETPVLLEKALPEMEQAMLQ